MKLKQLVVSVSLFLLFNFVITSKSLAGSDASSGLYDGPDGSFSYSLSVSADAYVPPDGAYDVQSYSFVGTNLGVPFVSTETSAALIYHLADDISGMPPAYFRTTSTAYLSYRVNLFSGISVEDDVYNILMSSDVPITLDYKISASSLNGSAWAYLSTDQNFRVDAASQDGSVITTSGSEKLDIVGGYIDFILYAESFNYLYPIYTNEIAFARAYADPLLTVDPNYEFYDYINISFAKVENYQISVSEGEPITPVPEPSTLLLLCVGLGGLALNCRRSK